LLARHSAPHPEIGEHDRLRLANGIGDVPLLVEPVHGVPIEALPGAAIVMTTGAGYRASSAPSVGAERDGCCGGVFESANFVAPTAQAATLPLSLMSDSAGMPSPSCNRRIIVNVSGRLRESTS